MTTKPCQNDIHISTTNGTHCLDCGKKLTDNPNNELREDILEILDGHFDNYDMPSPKGPIPIFDLAAGAIEELVQSERKAVVAQGGLDKPSEPKQPVATKSLPTTKFGRVIETELKKGDVLFEDGQGGSVQILIVTEPEITDEQITFHALTGFGDITHYLLNFKYRHYGPRLVLQPSYFPVSYLSHVEVTDLAKPDQEASNDVQ
jgi:hypothetical protein